MGSFHGAEGCELVGLFILSQLNQINFNGGLYRDDRLGVVQGTRRQNENKKKELCEIFRRNNLRITVEVNLKVIDFLDVTLDLERDTYRPSLKQNNTLLYDNKASNHPPGILKNIPESVNQRLSSISANENTFREAIPPYQDALNKAGYNFSLQYNPPTQGPRNRRRKRKIIWYNPPYCKSLKTNLGKDFLTILRTCFPEDNPLHKIFNKNTL